MFTTRVITKKQEFADCAESWNQLAADRLFHRWEWMFSWWENFGDRGELTVVVVSDPAGRWVGVAPWYKTRSASRGRVVRTLGSGAACSDYASIAVKPGFQDIVAHQLVQLMTGDHPQFCDVDLYELEGHLAADPVVAAMVQAALPEALTVDQQPMTGTWRSSLPEAWESFEGDLKKSFRRKTKKAMQRLASPEFHAQVYWTPESLEPVWPLFVDLHQRRRQYLGQPGCFADPAFERFLKSATMRLAASGKAQINMIFHLQEPLACNLEFAQGSTIFMYQTGVDPDKLNLEPGHLTFCWAIRESITRQFRQFDFLRGDEPYKRFWNAEPVPLYCTRLVPDRLVSNLRFGLASAGMQLRHWAHQVKSLSER